MSDNKDYTINFGGPAFLLFLVFLWLKLGGFITWSWWAVTAPLWVPVAAVLAFVTIAFIAALVVAGVSGLKR